MYIYIGGGDARATHRDVGAFQRSFALRHFSHRERELGGRAPTSAGADPALLDCFTSTLLVALLVLRVLRANASLRGPRVSTPARAESALLSSLVLY